MNDKLTRVATFGLGGVLWVHCRLGVYSLQFVFDDGSLTASVDNHEVINTRDADYIRQVKAVLQESRSDDIRCNQEI